MANISEEKWIEMLEKKADGSYIAKYPKVKSKSGVTFDEHLADYKQHTPYAIAIGTNFYAVSIPGISSLVEGMSVKVKFTSANTGASTLNINGLGAKEIRKSNGNSLSAGNIKAGQICHLVYTGSVFQLLGEGGEYGTAQAQDVLEGKTIGTEGGIVTGTMPNNGAINKTITSQGGQIVVPEGYHDGSGIVKAQFDNLIANNIRNGVRIGGVRGDLVPMDTVNRSSVLSRVLVEVYSSSARFVDREGSVVDVLSFTPKVTFYGCIALVLYTRSSGATANLELWRNGTHLSDLYEGYLSGSGDEISVTDSVRLYTAGANYVVKAIPYTHGSYYASASINFNFYLGNII